MTIHRRRLIAWLILQVIPLLVLHSWFSCQAEAPRVLPPYLTLTAKALVCPPNCDMIPTAEGTPDNVWWPYKCYLPMIRSK